MEEAVGSEQAVTLPRARRAVNKRLAAQAGDDAAGFLNEDVAGADVPVVKGFVGVDVIVRVAARVRASLTPAE